MNRFCERCERVTADGNLWCPERDCPAEEGFPVLGYGDYVGDLKVSRLLRVWRTAALYEAQRESETVLLKVAHSNDACEERLKRETNLLASLSRPALFPISFVQSFFPGRRPALPVVLPPYPVPSKRWYGEITVQGESKIYAVYRHAEGKFLSDLLLEQPQIWHYEAAWLIIALADALRPLVSRNQAHLNLQPDILLVDVDSDGHFRPLLLDLGFIVEGPELEKIGDFPRLCEPAYTAPELLSARGARAAGLTADVYSLGLLLYEVLAGKPVFDSKLLRDDQIREIAEHLRGVPPVDRPELESAGVIKILERAVAPTGRYKHALDFAQALAAVYGRAPAERRPAPSRLYVLVGVVATVLLVTVISAIYILARALTG